MSASTWQYISNIRNLYGGCEKSYSRKSKKQRKKREVREVMEDIDRMLADVYNAILNGTYEPGEYRHYTLIERDKKRNISVLPFIDRSVQNMLKDAVEPILMRKMLDEQTAGLPHRGLSSKDRRYNTIHKMRKAVTNRDYKFCVLLDIHHCYENINNVVTMKLLEELIKDRRTLSLLRKHLFAQSTLAIGDPISHLYCNLVISVILRYLKEECKCPCLVNYADNIAVFGRTIEEVREYYRQAKLIAARLRLRFNRCYPFSLDKVPEFTWCGRKYSRNGKVLLRQSTKKRIIKARNNKKSMGSYKGVLMSCNCRNLAKAIKKKVIMQKQRTSFAGKSVKADNLVGIKHTIVKVKKRASKKEGSEYYYDVQAIAVGLGLIRYTTSSKLLVQSLSTEEPPIRDVVISKDWRGLYYEGSVYTNEEEADIIRKEFGINY